MSSLSSLSHADYQIRIPIHQSINFNSDTSGGGNGGTPSGPPFSFTDPTVAADYETECSGFSGYTTPITNPYRNENLHCGNYAGMDLSGMDLDLTGLRFSNLDGDILTNAGFVNTNLTNANLIGADLINTSFTNVDFTNILYDATTKWPSWYKPPQSSNGYQFTPEWQ